MPKAAKAKNIFTTIFLWPLNVCQKFMNRIRGLEAMMERGSGIVERATQLSTCAATEMETHKSPNKPNSNIVLRAIIDQYSWAYWLYSIISQIFRLAWHTNGLLA